MTILISFVPMYLIAVPACLLMLKKLPAEAPEPKPLGAKSFFILLLIFFAVTYTGNVIGTLLSALLSNGNAENVVMDTIVGGGVLAHIFATIVAPIAEEYIFRKQIIDRTRKYGETTAAFFSAITFGLFHANLFQFFYAFAVGWLLAYIYIRTGRLRYVISVHVLINFFGSVVSSILLENMEISTEALTAGTVMTLVYSLFVITVWISGIVLAAASVNKLVWKKSEYELARGERVKYPYFNSGMIAFTVLCLVMIAFYLI
ncbi:MAG: CPBP family intramembrane metalloprotease [Clostridia bacterium]|nr:CPBP family intramembrane metalloprotease [Clostridia bacterium]